MTVAIGLGLMEFPFAGASDYWRWVDLCEAGGVDSLWQTDRLVSRQPILECMAVMAALAGRTRRLRFGMNVVSLALRDPVLLAKQCATIDVLSEGRLLPGFGIGSPLGPGMGGARHRHQDARPAHRRGAGDHRPPVARGQRRLRGQTLSPEGGSISPKPVQPDLPMWIGGSSEAAIRRTARYGTGWQSGAEQPDAVGKVVAAIKKARPKPAARSTRIITGRPSRSTSAARRRVVRARWPPTRSGRAAIRRLFRRRRREGDPRPGCRVRRCRRREVHPAAGRARWRRDHRPDQEAHRQGAAAGRSAVAQEGRRRLVLSLNRCHPERSEGPFLWPRKGPSLRSG